MENHLNVSARDNRISFIEDTHTYLIDGHHVPGLVSVTEFIHSNFSHFDADAVIKKMMASPRWTSSPYYGKTPDTIKAQWDRQRDEAADAGTKMHLAIEHHYGAILGTLPALPSKPATPEYAQFEKFAADHARLVPFRTEWRIFDEDLKIAGSIDMVFRDPDHGDGHVQLYDWKRSKEIKQSNFFQKGVGVLSHLDDCNYNHYSLQLNMYKYILEKNYGLTVTKMAIVVFHPSIEQYNKIPIPTLDGDIHRLVVVRKTRLQKSSSSS